MWHLDGVDQFLVNSDINMFIKSGITWQSSWIGGVTMHCVPCKVNHLVAAMPMPLIQLLLLKPVRVMKFCIVL